MEADLWSEFCYALFSKSIDVQDFHLLYNRSFTRFTSTYLGKRINTIHWLFIKFISVRQFNEYVQNSTYEL